MNTASVEKLRNVPGGPMSENEAGFCQSLRLLIQAVIEGRVPFNVAMRQAADDLLQVRSHDLSLDSAIASGHKLWVESLVDHFSAAPPRVAVSAADLEFLKDLDAILDFALRNGLTFNSVLLFIMHDIPTIAKYGSVQEAADKDFFTPKLKGWAQTNIDEVGDVIESSG
ncbi:MAG TPA: hypothetical protein VH370_11250 [Humisphaera sp.]|jgi:hypothetical protein|nr:hypothetical protein [Humisphaera sp.]